MNDEDLRKVSNIGWPKNNILIPCRREKQRGERETFAIGFLAEIDPKTGKHVYRCFEKDSSQGCQICPFKEF